MPDEDQLFLHPAKPPPAGISEDLYRIIDDHDLLKAQFTPKRRVWQAAILGMIGGAAATAVVLEGLSRFCH
jgi:hypothetical protein